MKLTDRQTAWLIRHFKHTKNDDICAKLGISTSYLHRLAREYGLTKTRQFMRKMQLAASRAGVIAIANEDDEAKERRRQQANKNRNPDRCFKAGRYALGNKTAEERAAINEKRRQSWLKTRMDDEIRLNWGYERKTRFRYRRLQDPEKNRKAVLLRSYMRRIGYAIEERGGMVVLVTPETKRSQYCEEKAIKLGFRVRLMSA